MPAWQCCSHTWDVTHHCSTMNGWRNKKCVLNPLVPILLLFFFLLFFSLFFFFEHCIMFSSSFFFSFTLLWLVEQFLVTVWRRWKHGRDGYTLLCSVIEVRETEREKHIYYRIRMRKTEREIHYQLVLECPLSKWYQVSFSVSQSMNLLIAFLCKNVSNSTLQI